jgi:hypothetical protein
MKLKILTIDFFVVSLQKIYKNMETKKCSKCGEVKPINEFYKHKMQKDGLNSQCKCCVNKTNEEYRKKHPKERRKYQKKYLNKYKKEHKEYLNKYKKEHVVALLKDCYIKDKLILDGWRTENITEEIIEEKRNIIKTKRLINKINKSIN